jgi:hypothetical protein
MSSESNPATPNVKEYTLNNLADFDKSRVVIHDPTVASFTIGEAEINTTTSAGRYLDDNGEECELYFAPPPQNCFGVNYIYDIGLKKEDQVPENAKGLQVCYPATTLKTVNQPTPQEQEYIDMMTGLWELAVEKGRQEAEREEPLIPAPSVASCLAAEKAKKMDRFVKPPMEFPKEKGKKTLDTTKPKRTYVKLVTTGKGVTLKASTKFYGPGDKPTSALRYVDKRGTIQPCFRWEGIYWGSHGPSAPHGASLRFKLTEANYTPQTSSSVPAHRMLGKNTAPVQEDDDDIDVSSLPRRPSEEDDGGEAEGFQEPGADDANPVQALAAAAKKSVKPVAKAVAKPVIKVGAAPKGKTVAAKKAGPAKTAPAKAPAKPKVPVRKAAPPPPPQEEVEETPEEEIQEPEEQPEDE